MKGSIVVVVRISSAERDALALLAEREQSTVAALLRPLVERAVNPVGTDARGRQSNGDCGRLERGLKPRDIDEQVLDRYIHRSSARLHSSTRIALGHVLEILRGVGVCPPPPFITRGPDQLLEDEFRQHLVENRGLAARTVEHGSQCDRRPDYRGGGAGRRQLGILRRA